jgi:ferredoxin
MPLKVLHEKWKCIACNACAAMAPEFWTMETEDGKSHLIGSEKKVFPDGEGEELDISVHPDGEQKNKDAAEVCPVQCIHVRKSE